jgi:predicted GIY-YIG superfamily endonuclease
MFSLRSTEKRNRFATMPTACRKRKQSLISCHAPKDVEDGKDDSMSDDFDVSDTVLEALEDQGELGEKIDPEDILVAPLKRTKKANVKEKVHGVYILASLDWKYTYVGYTVDFRRRLRQHNREIKGGAKATAGRTWQMVLQITGLPDKHHALSLEWHLKHYKVRRSDVVKYGHDTFPIDSPSKAMTRRLRKLMVVMEKRQDKFPNLVLTF